MSVITSTFALNQNEVTAALFNQVISQEVFGDNIKDPQSLVELFRVDGTLFGDTKTYISTDILVVKDWATTGSSSLLTEAPPPAPKLEAIAIDQFRQIAVTIYPYMQKRAFMNEGTFGQFLAVVESWLAETKRVYELTLINPYVGTLVTTSPVNTITVTKPALDPTEADLIGAQEALNRKKAMAIGKDLADLFVDLQDATRKYNAHQFMRSYNMSDFVFVWNAEVYNEIRKVDLPTIFHNEGLVGLDGLEQRVLPARYFGTINTGTTAAATWRKLAPGWITVSGTPTFFFGGDLVGNGTTVAASSCYIPDAKIIGKLVHKKAIPFMSAFSVGTSCFDAQKLREQKFLTFGHSTPDYIRNFPVLTVAWSA